MHSTNSPTTKRLMTLAMMLLVIALLAACGGSSKGSSGSSSTASAAAGTTTTGGPNGRGKPGGNRFAAVRECMKKQGITLPTFKRPSGGNPPTGGSPAAGGGGGLFLGGGASQRLPKGVTRAQYEAALKKCGGRVGLRAGRFGGRNGLNSSGFRSALTRFAACMRQAGINVPAPNTNGKGPIFNVKGIDTKSAKFVAAQRKCSSLLRLAGTGGPAGAGGAPGGAPPAGG